MTRRTLLALSSFGVALALPAGAAAASRAVDLSPPAKSGKSFQKLGADANAFLPRTTTVHPGDRVVFHINGFHNVNVVTRGKAQPLFVPSGTVSGALDAGGSPFWFNGRPKPQFNPAIFVPGGPTSATTNGTRTIFSKVPVAGPPKPFTVKFARRGTYTLLCSVHPGMKGQVVVVARGRRIPSARAHAAAEASEVKADLAAARKLLKSVAPRNTVNVGQSAAGGVESFAMFPRTLAVKRGTTVRFRMSARSFDDHTATFGHGDPETQPRSYLGALAASLNSPVVDPAVVYPSDPRLVSLTAMSHGNGFWNSGVIDTARATPLPSSGRVTFSQAGRFTYYCLIHPFMKGTIRVR